MNIKKIWIFISTLLFPIVSYANLSSYNDVLSALKDRPFTHVYETNARVFTYDEKLPEQYKIFTTWQTYLWARYTAPITSPQWISMPSHWINLAWEQNILRLKVLIPPWVSSVGYTANYWPAQWVGGNIEWVCNEFWVCAEYVSPKLYPMPWMKEWWDILNPLFTTLSPSITLTSPKIRYITIRPNSDKMINLLSLDISYKIEDKTLYEAWRNARSWAWGSWDCDGLWGAYDTSCAKIINTTTQSLSSTSTQVSTNVAISQTELSNYLKEWNILSDIFTSQNECNTTKDKYNLEYTSYKRSNCFLNEGKYYYFICQLGNSCSVNTNQTLTPTNTITTTVQEVPNKAKLDVVLTKISQFRKEFNNDTKYEKLLNQIETQLSTLWEKYKTSAHVTQMVSYLWTWIQTLKSDLVPPAKSAEEVFCVFLWNCPIKTSTGSTNSNTTTNTTNPVLSVDKATIKEGEDVVFTWNAKDSWVQYCTYFVNGNSDGTKLLGTNGNIPVGKVPAWNYNLQLECKYTTGATKKSNILTVNVTPIVSSQNNNSTQWTNPLPNLWNTSTNTKIQTGTDANGTWFTVELIRDPKSLNSQSFIDAFKQFKNEDRFYVNIINSKHENPRVITTTGELYMSSNGKWVLQSVSLPTNIIADNKGNSSSGREKTSFWILYTTLHCPGITNNWLWVRYTLGDDLVYNNPKYPQALYYWGKPALWHYCLTWPEGEQVLKEHARLLSEGWVDYIIIDATNHAYTDSRSDRTSEMILEPTKKLLQVWSTISNAPKVVIWAPIVEWWDVYKELLQELQKYPKLQFSYKWKPLILNAVDTSRYTSDVQAIETLSKTMTVRDMWWMSGIGTKWQFMNPTWMQGPNNGEQISVSPAYQMTYMTRDTAVWKNNWETFKSQFASVFAYAGIDTVVISSWNEWASIRLQDVFDNSKAAYTDTYDEERNRDIEPQSWGKWDFYYQLMKKCISAYKSGKNSCE